MVYPWVWSCPCYMVRWLTIPMEARFVPFKEEKTLLMLQSSQSRTQVKNASDNSHSDVFFVCLFHFGQCHFFLHIFERPRGTKCELMLSNILGDPNSIQDGYFWIRYWLWSEPLVCCSFFLLLADKSVQYHMMFYQSSLHFQKTVLSMEVLFRNGIHYTKTKNDTCQKENMDASYS